MVAAGKHGPVNVFFFVDGFILTAAKLQALRSKVTAKQIPSDGLGDIWEEHSPLGTKLVELAQEGAFFDTATGGSHAALKTVPGTPQAVVRVVSYGRAGDTIGEEFEGALGVYNHEYELIATRDDLQRANTAYQVSGQHDVGQVLQNLAAKTIDWNTEATPVDYSAYVGQRVVPITSSSVANPSIITTTVPHGLTVGGTTQKVLISGHSGATPSINSEHIATYISATTFSIPVNVTVGGTGGTLVRTNTIEGGVGYLQVTSVTTFTNFIGTIKDSDDDITYNNLIVFTDNVSAPFAERLTVAGLVDRYLDFDGNITGSGSITAWCGFARNGQ